MREEEVKQLRPWLQLPPARRPRPSMPAPGRRPAIVANARAGSAAFDLFDFFLDLFDLFAAELVREY